MAGASTSASIGAASSDVLLEKASSDVRSDQLDPPDLSPAPERLQARRQPGASTYKVTKHHNFVGDAQVLVQNAACVGEEDGLGGQTEISTGDVTADADLGAA